MTGPPILTAAEMRAAEAEAIAGGTSAETLMQRAGQGAAEAIWRFVGPMRALVLCGPGNNGGDGYVIARSLHERGVDVSVAALGEPGTGTAQSAASCWDGASCSLAEAQPAPLLIDALFGTGLTRPLDAATCAQLARLSAAALVRVAVDLPSGVGTDDGAILSRVAAQHLTVTFATLKPSHLLQPAAERMGRTVVVDIGIEPDSRLRLIERPRVGEPGSADHKYSRGYVGVVAGEMVGAAALTASAALRAGAGYVRLASDPHIAGLPHAIVQGERIDMHDARIGAVVVGPGLGRDEIARARLDAVLASDRPLVLDADALVLLAGGGRVPYGAILTPHAGEFERLFPSLCGSKVERARQAAAALDAVIVFKGADTVVAAPDGRAAIALPAPGWLASAGTGDVLAGVIAAMLAGGRAPFEAACAGVWLHRRAAEIAGPGPIADDLLAALPAAFGECL
jgi:hydroxyethylthiazole kinase-like uncharacterized protein yjeF